MQNGRLKLALLRVTDKISHAWGARMGTLPQYNNIIPMYIAIIVRPRGASNQRPLAQDPLLHSSKEKNAMAEAAHWASRRLLDQYNPTQSGYISEEISDSHYTTVSWNSKVFLQVIHTGHLPCAGFLVGYATGYPEYRGNQGQSFGPLKSTLNISNFVHFGGIFQFTTWEFGFLGWVG